MFVRLALAVAFAAGAAGVASGAEWSTSYGRMSLPDQPQAGSIRVNYSSDEGRIIGSIAQPKCMGCGLELRGIWVERGSAQACDSAADGSNYWGNVEFRFNSEFTSFEGEWDYCGSGPTHDWRGQIGSSRLMLEFR